MTRINRVQPVINKDDPWGVIAQRNQYEQDWSNNVSFCMLFGVGEEG